MNAARLSDHTARERIIEDLEANLCVEAGAGTGKTTVLVKRVVNLLASGTATVDELVVITFTEKAAAELATRVRDELEQRARAATGAERSRVLQAARDLYRSHIETIHSFAAALLRERPVEANLDPLFDVLDQLAAGLEFDNAYERFQDELFSQPRPELERALRRGFGLTELREACELLHEHRYLLPIRHPDQDGDDLANVMTELCEIAEELREMLVQHQPGDDRAVPLVDGIIDWIERIVALETLEQERWLLFRSRANTHLGKGSNANWGGEKDRLKQLQRNYVETLETAKAQLRTNALLDLLPHIEGFVQTYEAERKRAGRADFDDLLFWARDMLRNSEPARNYFRRRFRALLIDEFQDTDPVQAELALLLTSDEEPGKDWRALRPAAGRLTVVGDPKQSIYRFRRADMTVYDQVKEGPLAQGEEQISTNFRSNPSLLVGLNVAFDKILEAKLNVQPGNVELKPPPGSDPARRAPIILAEGAMEGDADTVRAAEAGVIAGLLQAAHLEGWEIRDRHDEDRWRTCRSERQLAVAPARNPELAPSRAGCWCVWMISH